MGEAERQERVPVLVAYNVPFRDCSQYSSGGARDAAAYEAWIDGFARGLGKSKAVVIVEPDGLGIIPYNTTIYGAADWSKPVVTDAQGNVTPAPGATPAERYAQINYAVDAIEGQAPRALGLRPTASTGTPLLAAYLWIKTPGESDGSCNRGVTGVTTDPEWGGIVDPAAGAWFPDQALQLASLASPALF